MAIRITTGDTTLPDARALNTAQPARGLVYASLADALASGVGWRALRVLNIPFQIGDWTTDDTAAAQVLTTARLSYTPSPLARYVFGAVRYLVDDSGTGSPSMTLSLETTGAVAIDTGVTWSVANGLLGGRFNTQRFADTVLGELDAAGAIVGREAFATTGWAPETPTSGLPRLLDADGYQGVRIIAKLTMADVRVYGLTLVEAVRVEV